MEDFDQNNLNDQMKMQKQPMNPLSPPVEYKMINFIPVIHKFFSDVKVFDDTNSFLNGYRNNKVYDYGVLDSRKIFYCLVVYKFGKELEYPEPLQAKAREVIIYMLKNQETTQDQKIILERKKLVKQYFEQFEAFKKEDIKNYMFELGVQYHQLEEMTQKMTDSPEWLDSLQMLKDKIKQQVVYMKGEEEFKKCLELLESVKEQMVKQQLEKVYWDVMTEEIEQKKYGLMLKNYSEIKDILLEMRDDQDTKDILDEEYIRQLLEKDLFTVDNLISQVEFIFYKTKVYGIPIYDKLLDKSKNDLVEEIRTRGLEPKMISDVFKKVIPILEHYIDVIRMYRKEISKVNQNKKNE
jgi:hypothetical protein